MSNAFLVIGLAVVILGIPTAILYCIRKGEANKRWPQPTSELEPGPYLGRLLYISYFGTNWLLISLGAILSMLAGHRHELGLGDGLQFIGAISLVAAVGSFLVLGCDRLGKWTVNTLSNCTGPIKFKGKVALLLGIAVVLLTLTITISTIWITYIFSLNYTRKIIHDGDLSNGNH
jgi:hypothetical protein